MEFLTLSNLAGVLFLLTYALYIPSILRGESKPSRASWIIWASLDVITVSSMYAKHTLNLLIVAAAIGATVVATLSFKYGKSGWDPIDILCLGAVGLSLILWVLLGDAIYGLMTTQVGNVIATLPTIKKVWSDPTSESKYAWTLASVACALLVLGIPEWSIAHALQPLVFLTLNVGVLLIMLRRQPLRATA
jgi:hypothetical protein